MASSLASGDEADVRKQIQETFPYEISNECVSGVLRTTDWKCLYTQIHMGLPVIPISVTILFLRRNIILELKRRTMSENTRRMHSQLLKVSES